jgi:hypothetical protein
MRQFEKGVIMISILNVKAKAKAIPHRERF